MGLVCDTSFPLQTHSLVSILGLLPIFQWLVSLERNPQPTRNLHVIERLQGWSMLAYYPLEHLYYLGSHGIIPTTIRNPLPFLSKKTINLDPNRLGIWSCRFWALYVLLQFAHLREDRRLLQLRQKALRRAKGTGLTPSEKQEIAHRWDAWWSEVVVNLGYLPLTIHWYVVLACGVFVWRLSMRSSAQVARKRTL